MRAVLAIPAFRRFFVASLITQAGDQVHRIALYVLVYQLTGSTAMVAAVLSAQLLVNVFLSPLLATWAERKERRGLFIASQVVQGLLVLLIPLVGTKSLLALWAIVFAVHIFQRLEYPLIAAITPELVPKEHLDEANGLVSFTQRFSEVAVVGLAGVLVAAIGPVPAFYLNAASFFVTAFLLLGLPRIPPPPAEPKDYLEQLKEGFSFLLSHPVLRRVVGALFVAALLGSVENVLGVVLALGVLNVGSEGYGAIEMALALGAVLGAVWVPVWTRRIDRERVFAYSFLLFGVGIASVALWPVFPWAVAAYFLSGLFNQGFLVPVRSLLQLETPKHLVTRVFGAVGSVTGTAVLLGVMGGGVVADRIGVLPTYFLAGMGVALVGVYLIAIKLRSRYLPPR